MSRFRGYSSIMTMTALIAAGMIMSPSYAKPDLTTPVNMSLLHAKDTGYHFIYHDFSAPAPKLSPSMLAHSTTIQTYAKPRYYRVWLAIPKQRTRYKTSDNSVKPMTKVLYMLDGNAAIDDLDKDTLLSLSKSTPQSAAPALVFIGYQTPYRFDVDARAYDYTPPLLANTTDNGAFQEESRERLNGGAEDFYTLIEKEIKPWVYKQLGEKPNQEAIWGHSYGGLFVLYNLFKHPKAYQQYFSADPSLWWQEGEITKYWQAYQKSPEFRLLDKHKNKQLRLTFSETLEQKSRVEKKHITAVTATILNKQDFAQEVCDYFQNNCSYQTYQQSHGELFKTSLLDSLKTFKH